MAKASDLLGFVQHVGANLHSPHAVHESEELEEFGSVCCDCGGGGFINAMGFEWIDLCVERRGEREGEKEKGVGGENER